ncbi:ABC transporter ATP-binding protein [Rhodococcus maanshanensis]|uniref:ABC transporter ATP-binding protein n=1 Tax=Rhodococcus maanshanensis TaxID=183556 RepID=UPI0022B2BAAC|nr:ABC transporter ATP-binding protein [Rhodococcus maanshanensis]MCZ4556783.1 ABC transporter ATP-binding protein [Rhodococcus maanshanensis]
MIRMLSGLTDLRAVITMTALTAVVQGVLFALLVPVLRALFGPTPAQAWPWIAALTVAAIGYGVLFQRTARAGYQLGGSVLRALHHRLGDHVSTLPLGWFGPQRVGELGTLAGEGVMAVANTVANLLRPIVSAVVTPATVVLLMLVFDWHIALAILATTPFIAAAFWWTGRLVQHAEQGSHAATAAAGTRVVEYAQAQRILRSSGQISRGFSALDEALVAQRDAGRRLITFAVPGLVSFTLVVQAAFTVALWYGTYLVTAGELDTPTLLALLVLAVRFVEPLIAAGELGGALKVARNHLQRVHDILATQPLPEPADPAHPDGAGIEFDRVTFGYSGANGETGTPVLDDVSFTIPTGKLTALAGPSGAGKTTVTRLIARFFDTDAGTIRVGGCDVRDLRTEVLMSKLSLVFQDVYLFDGSILDNIRLARPDATDEQVHDAAAAARVDEIVARLPQGWDTRVGEAGAILSGGERQRISIARAMLKDAPIVLADEPTSALDPENEAAIRAGLHALAANRTVLVIAHRPATFASADQVLFLADGAIAEHGRHDDLVAAGGRYAQFWRARESAQGWRLVSADHTETEQEARA